MARQGGTSSCNWDNCSAPNFIDSLIKEIKGQTSKPIIVYPNSGEEYDATSKTWNMKMSSTKQLTSSTQRWYEAGAKVIGSCCRTKPKDIEAITYWASRQLYKEKNRA